MDIAKLLGGIDLDDVRKVAQLATQLPGMMSEFGDKLADAGGQARTAATALAGAAPTLGAIGTALDNCKQQLGTATNLLSTAAQAAKAVPLLGGPAGEIAESVQSIAKVVDQLGELGGHMRNLSEVIATVGTALGGLGDRLGDSGATARGFAAIPPAG